MTSRNPAVAHVRSSDGESQYLRDHLRGVGRRASIFAAKIGCALAGELQGLVHDLGKYSAEFIAYLGSATGLLEPDDDDYVDPASRKGRIDHSTAGAQLVWRDLSNADNRASAVAQILALNIASHHSGMIDCISSSEGRGAMDNFARRMDKPDEATHLNEALRSADWAILDRYHELIAAPELVDSVVGLLEKIRKQEPSRLAQHQQFGLATRFLFSCLIDADRIDSAEFERGQLPSARPMGDYVPWPVLAERLERHLAAFKPEPGLSFINEQRRAVADACRRAAESKGPGVYTLTVPTGGGKTLASLRFAIHQARVRGLDRVVYVIPYTSIIDQNASVAREVLEPADSDAGSVVLEHHSNLTPEHQTWREKLLSEDWDAPVVFTTTVQFLEALFGDGTRGARRMHQLANAVVVFDEVQTLPRKCVHIFNNAINFLAEQCNSTVLFCTATQPLLDQVDSTKGAVRLAPGGELIPGVPGLFEKLRRVRVHYGRNERSYAQIARLAISQMRRESSCLVVANTKTSAQELYRICRDLLPKETVFHLSTNMCPAHRADSLGLRESTKAEENTIIGRLQKGLPTLCISTQLIEAGIDVDFGCVIRFLAGIDSIAQAAGRCNRHGRRRDGHGKAVIGRVLVVRCAAENLGQLEEIRKGQECARRILDEYADDPGRFAYNLVGPETLRLYYKYYFFECSEEMSYPLAPAEARSLGRSSETLLALLSTNSALANDLGEAHKSMFLRQSFMAASSIFNAIDAPQDGVVVPYSKDGRRLVDQLLDSDQDPNLQHALVRHAQRYTVSVYPHTMERLIQANAVREISATTHIRLLVDDLYYTPELGLAMEIDDEWRVQSMVLGGGNG